MTPKEEALRAERELRIQDKQTAELHPWRARFEAIDYGGRVAVDATLPLAAWIGLTYAAWGTSIWLLALAFFAGAAQFFYRYAVYRGIAAATAWSWKTARGAQAATMEERRKAAHAVAAKQKLEAERSKPRDTIDGVPIETIAAAIAASPDVPVQKTIESLDFSRTRANEIRQTLLAARFLIWPYNITDNTYCLGDAPIAIPDNNKGRATILHPTLLTAPIHERQTLITNALKRKQGITPDQDPYIRGELTTHDRNLMGRMVKYIHDAPPPKTQ